ncbi:tripartite tricarboxylate transporter substrate binding protein [Roseomonas sp. AR75]|uniref:Bug family tripartite tricarboxylate transporter substrate binding protein n=1 Tax=Roseomonas sp. AR75 TaxID=2562311 RepID=UPI0010C0AA1C|nr:tripartite tricarboxylate transporter substrate binding protein [Roseomonas sp. AR75]
MSEHRHEDACARPGRRALLLGSLGTLALPGLAQAQGDWPARNIRIVVPFAPGGSSDVSARLVANHLGTRLGRTVVVDNKPGAATVIGTQEVARSAPDGYTLLLTPPPFAIVPFAYANLPFNSERDFRPVALLVLSPNALMVSSDVPARSFEEFVALAKSRPGGMNYASPGNGSLPHVAFELLKLRAGIDLVHVPYRGGGPAVADLAAGRVQAMIASPLEAAGQVQAGRVRPLMVAGAPRISAWPEVPTADEAGLAGFSTPGWFGLTAPSGVPDAIVQRLNTEIQAVLRLPEVTSRLADMGASAAPGSPQAFGELIATQRTQWAEAVRAAGIRIE